MNKKNLLKGIVFLFSLFIICFQVTALPLTTADKAEALGKLNLLKGDGVDFKLRDQMKRSEAATIIVRLLGKEQFVKDNIAVYKITKFSDVNESQWFAPYVGYCVQEGIISGDTSGNFNPESFISEKAFLKLVIGTLGYKVGIDYTWDNAYKMAYDLGVVTDEQYKLKTQDNEFYTRGSMVDVIYNSLLKPNKETKKTIVNNLEDAGIITQDILVSLGLKKYDVITTIETVDVLNYNKVKIRLNEKITEFTEMNIDIYESNDKNNILAITVDSIIDNEILLTTSEQTPDKNYSIVITNVKDADENIINYLVSGSFIGFKPVVVHADFFRISKAEAINSAQISVTFTQPVNLNAFIPSYYQILEGNYLLINGSGNSIAFTQNDNYTVIITLKGNTLKADVDYWLKINGKLISSFGTELNEGIGESVRFKGKAGESDGLTVKRLYPINESTIYLEYNQEIDPNMAIKTFYYSIFDDSEQKVDIIKAELLDTNENKGKVVKLLLSRALDQQKKYSLTVNFMMDVSHQNSINELKYPLVSTASGQENLKVEFAQALSNESIIVYFNKALNPKAAIEPVYYLISGITEPNYLVQPVKGFYDGENNPKAIKLYLPKDKFLKESHIYSIRVLSSMPDATGNYSTQDSEYKFSGIATPAQSPRISEALIVGKDTIKLSFSEDITADVPNLLTTTYLLEYSNTEGVVTNLPVSFNYINSKIIILKFNELNYSTKYTLKYKSLLDSAGNNYDSGQSYINSVEIKLGRK